MSAPPTVAGGRLCIVVAAVLWSLSGLFTRLMQKPTSLELHDPALTPLQFAFFRALFAGLVMIPLVRPRDLRFRPPMPVMVGCFAIMNALFLSALALGSAANAILLQNTAPFFVVIATVLKLLDALLRVASPAPVSSVSVPAVAATAPVAPIAPPAVVRSVVGPLVVTDPA